MRRVGYSWCHRTNEATGRCYGISVGPDMRDTVNNLLLSVANMGRHIKELHLPFDMFYCLQHELDEKSTTVKESIEYHSVSGPTTIKPTPLKNISMVLDR